MAEKAPLHHSDRAWRPGDEAPRNHLLDLREMTEAEKAIGIVPPASNPVYDPMASKIAHLHEGADRLTQADTGMMTKYGDTVPEAE